MQDFEKLGVFYLGREYDLASRTPLDRPILYDSRDLLTHALCVGMTGSGKTGLCLSLIEEAILDGVPVIAIDPKGDLGNLLLTFPALAAEDFRPWIDEHEAARAGLTPDAFAARQADAWREGLAGSGQDGARIDRFRKAAELAIYTPGSRSGLPISVLRSFAAPPAAIREDPELLAERASSTALGLLSLAGVNAAPRSREHTIVTMVLTAAWKDGRDLDLPAVIQQVQSPPFDRIGVVAVDAFYPERDRFELAMQFNAVLATPGFEQWFDGEPLDPAHLLYTATGRPRVAIFSIAHLGDAERTFFVSLLLNQVQGWMRTLSGTSSLRAILYMDEIAGYFPPVANPPSKAPLLTLLKQGRAFGLGIVLATQNPVDLDYKGLANIGTWFLGRLQTDRDKARLLDGLEGAAGGSIDRAQVDRMLSALDARVFLLHNVHEQQLRAFQTRWTMSYLRGPLSRDQIRVLMDPVRGSASARPARADAPVAASEQGPPDPQTAPAPESRGPRRDGGMLPVLPPGIQQVFIPRGSAVSTRVALYSPVVVGAARVAFSDRKAGVDVSRDVVYATAIADGPVPVDWATATALDAKPSELHAVPEGGASFEPVPPAASQPRNYAAWEKSFTQWLSQNERIELLRHRESSTISQPGESEREFRIRVQDAARIARDEAVDAVRKRYASKQATLAEKLRRAEAAVGRENEQASQQKLQTAVSFGATLMGAFLGRKGISASTLGRATTAVRGVGRTMKETSDVQRAAETVAAVRAEIAALDDRVREETASVTATLDRAAELERVTIVPKRGQVSVQFVALGWDPQ